MPVPLRRGALAIPVLLATILPLAVAAPAARATGIRVAGGRTQPAFSYADAVREHVMVQAPVDSDEDGQLDRVGVDIIRPRETEHGLKVPVIMDESPYYDNLGRGNESERKQYDASGRPVKFPLFYDNYFVPRGYAVLLVDMIGTNTSDGCPSTGGHPDVAGGKAVIDWLNGRAPATYPDGRPAVAYWTTGKVAMVGKSYDGTLPNAVAATGVAGLETIVPIAAISSWYGYYRMNGVVYFRNGPRGLARTVDTDPDEKCAFMHERLAAGADDATGNYNAFWDERNYLDGTIAGARNVRASVFVVHGLNDLNVKPNHFSQWWQALARRGVPRKLWLAQYGHVEPFDFRREVWIDTLHRWFDYWLHGIDNGIMRQPRVDVQVAPDRWVTQQDWPTPGARRVPLWLGPGQEGAGGPGSLRLLPAARGGTLRFTDDPDQTESEMVADPTVARENRLVFLTPPLRRALRLSGVPQVDITASLDAPSANLTALIVDYGEAERVDHLGPGEGITTLPEESCHGESTSEDDACYRRTATVTRTAPVEIVARGWLDASNRRSLTDPEPLEPGRRYRFRWETLPLDDTVEAGHRLALVLAGSDPSETVPDQPARATVTVSLRSSRLFLPVVLGGPGAAPEFAPVPAPGTWRGPRHVELPAPPREFA